MQTSGTGSLPDSILQISVNKSFKIEACRPCDPSKVTVGTNDIFGRRASVNSPCIFNNSDPCKLVEHFSIFSESMEYSKVHWNPKKKKIVLKIIKEKKKEKTHPFKSLFWITIVPNHTRY